jgi:superfamily II DNA or RNA helicase
MRRLPYFRVNFLGPTTPSPDEDLEAPNGLRGLNLAIGYDSGDEALRAFYVPSLGRSISYDRSVGYFRASALSAAARGVSRFVAGGGTMRLLVGAELTEADREALIGATEIHGELADRLASELVTADEIAQRRLEVLAWLVREGRLTVKVAVPVDGEGVPVPPQDARPFFHEKVGVLRDRDGNGVAFQGSVNESETAWTQNFESFSVYKSWDGSASYFDEWANRFEQRWAGDVSGFKVFDLPEALTGALLALAPTEVPAVRDIEEGPEPADPDVLATFLELAPRLPRSQALAEATSGVRLFPHQRKVVERLAGEYPRSWLCCDEVGLGKTISSGMALRRLLLAGEVERVLVLAPANVCRQWQDELFEKMGLWVPRMDGGRIYGAHPDDVRVVPEHENPYATEPVLIVSSHLARRPRHRQLILDAPSLDLLVVDEAHHARRRAADLNEYRPSRLLELLDEIDANGHARATWLLTATPMQIHPIELVDLLRHVGLEGPLAAYANFDALYAELAKQGDGAVNWDLLANLIGEKTPSELDDAERAFLARVEAELGGVQAERIRQFGTSGMETKELVQALGAPGRRELRNWVRLRSPVGRFVTRHSRKTLKRYRDQGLLDEPIADRDVRAVSIPFSPEEEDLYGKLDVFLNTLMQAHGTRRGVGFILTVYRRRLTSSWAAIATTLQRRLAREGLMVERDILDEEDADVEVEGGTVVDDVHVLPLSEDEIAMLHSYVDELGKVGDSKFEQLRKDIDAARGSGRSLIIFTQFTDTLNYLRERLHPAYRSHLATYTGDGGAIWGEESGWRRVAKKDLVDALRSGRVSVILATDAASEGLNLQAASQIVNWDLPWSPSKVEQRIGRVDRVGQRQPVVYVRNYVVPGTIEEDVYAALAQRIDVFSGLLGHLQPILGATEAAFQRIFQAPMSEREDVRDKEIAELVSRVDDLERTGLDLGDEDPLPDPVLPPTPVDLLGLRAALVEDLADGLDTEDRPATFAPDRVSRDPETWCALSTYGHPRLAEVLRRHTQAPETGLLGSVAWAEVSGVWAAWRADRTPPAAVRVVDDLTDLGEPVAAGEAQDRALREARDAAGDRVERRAAALRVGRERQLGDLRRSFVDLVHEVVNAESALHARQGEGFVEPRLVWMDVIADQATAWRNAEALRQYLDLEVKEILPTAPAGDDPRSDAHLAGMRVEAGRRLNGLVRQWNQTQ